MLAVPSVKESAIGFVRIGFKTVRAVQYLHAIAKGGPVCQKVPRDFLG
jgi:hypothetical protein